MQTLAKAATEDAKLEEKQSSQVVKALVDEQKAENQADDAAARMILQQAMNQPKEPTPPMAPEKPTPPEEPTR
jgi:RNase H-fold protein (predicted Holliday junction resolvase)